jgi:hypothetical protein
MNIILSMRASNPFDRTGLTRVGHVTRGRIPGPTADFPDPGSVRKLNDVRQAWELARARYLDKAIRDYTSDDFGPVVEGAIDPLLLSVGIVGGTEAVGASSGGAVVALGLGLGAMPVATTGSRLGRDFGRALLDWLGLGALSEHVAGHLDAVGAILERGIRTAWHSGASFVATHAAAHDMADAFGIFFGLILQALVAATSRAPDGPSSEAATIPLATILQSTRPAELGGNLEDYLLRNAARLAETKQGRGGREEPRRPPLTRRMPPGPQTPRADRPVLTAPFQSRVLGVS